MMRLAKVAMRAALLAVILAAILVAANWSRPPIDRAAAFQEWKDRSDEEWRGEKAAAEAAKKAAEDPDAIVQNGRPHPLGDFTRREQEISRAMHDAGMLAIYEADGVFGDEDSSPERSRFRDAARERNQAAVIARVGISKEEAEEIHYRVVRGGGIESDIPRGSTLEDVLSRFDKP